MKKTKTYQMMMCALFAALTAVLTQIAIPIGPVPINLATFAVFLAGALLGARLGAASMAVWVALGAVGVPVFSLMRGGLGMLTGPTGGYIVGYIPAAFLVGLVVDHSGPRRRLGNHLVYPVAMLLGMACYFVLGTAYYVVLTSVGVWEACMVCVVPFLPGDAVKITVASVTAHRLRTSHALHGAQV